MLSKTQTELQYTEMKTTNPDSRDSGMMAIATLLVATQNILNKEWMNFVR
jgi:hypothetical protein